MSQEIMVSVICNTYNHEKYIASALEGFVMQKTNFAFEILVHDDASTDSTADIIRDFEKKYPDLILPIYQTENQYSRGGGITKRFQIPRARGKYLAFCEGDDYWTDPLKLQKQVTFMELHYEYSVCFHRCVVYDTWNNKYVQRLDIVNENIDVSVDMYLNQKKHIGQPLTMLFRKEMYNFEWHKYYTRYCDTMEIMHLLLTGKGFYMAFEGGQYNLHKGGMSSMNPDLRRSWENCEDAQQMWNYTHHQAVKRFYIDAHKWRLDVCKRNGMSREYWRIVKNAMCHNLFMGLSILKYAIKGKIKD